MIDSRDEIQEIQALSKAEAELVRSGNPPINPWKIVGWQMLVTLAIGLLGLALTQDEHIVFSVLWGGLCVVIPSALFARGMTGNSAIKSLTRGASSFLIWELSKIALTIAMLWLAPRFVSNLSWLALVAGFIVVTKVYWLAGFCLIKKQQVIQ